MADDGAGRSRRSTLVGLALAVVVVGAGVTAAIWRADGNGAADAGAGATSSSVPVPTAVEDLEPGQCLDTVPEGDAVFRATVVPCDEPHLGEVAANIAHPGGSAFPGAEALSAQAYERCGAELETYVGAPEIRTPFDVSVLTPTEASWADGDRAITCIVVLPMASAGSTHQADLSQGWAGFAAPAGMSPGQCVAAGETLPADAVRLGDCAAAHAYELYAITHLDTPTFPGAEAMDAESARYCVDQFQSYVGRPYAGSETPVTRLFPTEQTWLGGSRTIACFIDSQGAAGSAKAQG
jgi:hypothetical protein